MDAPDSTPGRWRGLPTRLVEGGGTSLVVVPARGGKIVSLRGRDGAEWLAPGLPGPDVPPLGTEFEHAEMCGWDECAPTIDACTIADGSAMPDHGDAWDRAWDDLGDGRLAVALPSVGAVLERRISIDGSGLITFDYTASASPEREAAVLWAAHPQFRLLPGDTVAVDAREPLWDVTAGSAEGSAVVEPLAAEAALNRPITRGWAQKHYTDPAERPSWATLTRADGSRLRMAWSGAAVRTLGVWIDHAAYAAEPVVALEPATGWYDSLALAEQQDAVLRIPAGQTARWTVTIELTTAGTTG
jgi:hypothetical protein